MDPADPRGPIGVKEVYLAENMPDKAFEALQSELQQHPGRMDYRMALANRGAGRQRRPGDFRVSQSGRQLGRAFEGRGYGELAPG